MKRAASRLGEYCRTEWRRAMTDSMWSGCANRCSYPPALSFTVPPPVASADHRFALRNPPKKSEPSESPLDSTKPAVDPFDRHLQPTAVVRSPELPDAAIRERS